MAKREKRQMRIHYVEDRDEFQIQTRDNEDDEWGFVMGQRCVDGELINYRFLTQLRELAQCGFIFVAR